MEHLTRRRHALAEARRRGADCLLVTRMTHIRYLTGFTGSAGVLVLADDPLLVVDFRYDTQAREQVEALAVDGTSPPPGLWDRLLEVLRDRAPLAIGVDLRNLTAQQYLDLTAFGVQLIPADGVVEGLRAVKDPLEQEALAAAADLAEELVRRLHGWIRPGVSENDVAGEIERAQRQLGAERSAAPMIVSSGERTALPHGVATTRTMSMGEPVMFDLSPVVRGYRADLTRTVFLGTPPPEFLRIYHSVREAHDRSLAAVRAGIRCAELDALAREVLRRHDYERYFNHSLGHGIGLDQHEPPLLSPRDSSVLEAGMVVTIEPGVYIPGYGGVRIENAVVVTAEGCTPLSGPGCDLVTL